MAGRAQMSDNDESVWCALHFRSSMSPPVHGCGAFVCANVAYDVLLLIVVIWRDERRCWTMTSQSGARISVDHRVVVCAPMLSFRCTSTRLLVEWRIARRCRRRDESGAATREVFDHRSIGSRRANMIVQENSGGAQNHQ